MGLCPFFVGDWMVEPDLNRITRHGERRVLQPLVMKLLIVLAARPGALASKEDIVRELWPRSIVTENALARIVSQLRINLGDRPQHSRFIRTVMTKGYCLVAEVSDLPTPCPLPLARRNGLGESLGA